MRARLIGVLVGGALAVAGCSSAHSGTGHGAASGSNGAAGSGGGGFHTLPHGSPGSGGTPVSSPPSGSSHRGGTGGPRGDWAQHVDFSRLSHPDLDCSGAGEGGRVDVVRKVSADLTGDGLPEAVVVVQCAHAASEWPHSAYVYSDATGQPTLIGTLVRQGNENYVTGVRASGHTVTLTLRGWSLYAAGCCPDLVFRQVFTWTGSTFSAGSRTDVLHPCDGQGDALPISVVDDGGATGHAAITLVWRNRLPQSCTLTGFPGVDGEQSGGPTVHAARAGVPFQPVTLAPGGYASALLEWATIGSDGGSCVASSTDLLVTPPNTNATQTLAQHVGLCSLQIHPVVSGREGT